MGGEPKVKEDSNHSLVDDDPIGDGMKSQETVQSREVQAITEYFRARFNDPDARGAVQELSRQHSGGDVEWMKEHLLDAMGDDPRDLVYLRNVAQELEEYYQNLKPTLELFDRRHLEVRDRVARVIDQTLEGVNETYEKLSDTGELGQPISLVFRSQISKEAYYYMTSIGAKRSDVLEDVEHILEKEGVTGVDKGKLRSSLVLITSNRDTQSIGSYVYHLGGRADGFEGAEISLNDSFETADFLNLTVVPIGEYGADLTTRLSETLRRSAMVLARAKQTFREAEEEIGSEEVDKFVRSNDNNPDDPATMLLLYEGCLSIQQTISQLTAQKIEGYEYSTDDKLIDDIVSSGLIEQMARIMPLSGVIGPMTIMGMKFEDLVICEDGKLKLNRDIIKQLHHSMLEVRGTNAALGIEANSSGRVNGNAKGCPAAVRIDGEPSSVAEVTELFVKIFHGTSDSVQEPTD